jgi:transcriptional regulator with XRE-family HTH domain
MQTQSPVGLPETAARNIAELMARQGFSRFAVAKKAGIPAESFYRKIDRKPETLTLKEAADIAEALGVDPRDILFKAA